MDESTEIEQRGKEWAREITDRIRGGLESLSADIAEARQGGAHELLGYATWDEYAAAEFRPVVSALSSPIKRAMIHDLSESGLKQREIAAVTGVAQPNVSRTLRDISTDMTSPTAEEHEEHIEKMHAALNGARDELIDLAAGMAAAGVPENLVVDAVVRSLGRRGEGRPSEAVDWVTEKFEAVIRETYEVAQAVEAPEPQPLDIQLALLRAIDLA